MNEIEQIKALIEKCRKEKCVCKYRLGHTCDDCKSYNYLLEKINNPVKRQEKEVNI